MFSTDSEILSNFKVLGNRIFQIFIIFSGDAKIFLEINVSIFADDQKIPHQKKNYIIKIEYIQIKFI